jgi:hypothetical protein
VNAKREDGQKCAPKLVYNSPGLIGRDTWVDMAIWQRWVRQSAARDVAAQLEALRALFGLVPALMPVTGV